MASRGSKGTKGILLRLKSTVGVGAAEESACELPTGSVALGEIPGDDLVAAGAQAANNPTPIRAYRDIILIFLIKLSGPTKSLYILSLANKVEK